MADISKFKSPDNTEYTLKDSVSRFRLDVQTGTGTAGQAGSSSKAYIPALWKFNLAMTPVAGDIITITVPVAGISSGVWLSVDNGTHYYPIAVNNKTRLTTQYAINNQITLIYQTNMVTTTYGTDTSGAAAGSSTADLTSDRWCVLNYYDANTTYSAMSSSEMETGTATTSRVFTAAGIKAGLQAVLNVTSNNVQLYGSTLTAAVPAVTSSDNGKVLRVVSGAWEAASLPSASGVSF